MQSVENPKTSCSPVNYLLHQQVLDNRPKTERRKKRQRTNNHDHTHQQRRKQRRRNRKRAQRWRHDLLARQVSGDRQHRNDHQEPTDQHRHANRRVVPERVCRNAGESRTVVRRSGSKCVENLRQARAVRRCSIEKYQTKARPLRSPRKPESSAERRALPASPSSRRTIRSSCRGIQAFVRPSVRQ